MVPFIRRPRRRGGAPSARPAAAALACLLLGAALLPGCRLGEVGLRGLPGDPSTGRFKLANSWGVGGGWESVPDGFAWITFEALVANRAFACFYEDRAAYRPEYLAVFRLSHPVREDCQVTVYLAASRDGGRIAQKRFEGYSGRGGPHPFPDNALVMDISEFGGAALNRYDLFLQVADSSAHAATGTVVSFQVERYDGYPGAPAAVLASGSAGVPTVNGGAVVLAIDTAPDRIGTPPAVAAGSAGGAAEGAAGAASAAARARAPAAAGRLSRLVRRRGLTPAEVQRFRELLGTREPGRGYNPLVGGHGTGLRPPSDAEWSGIAARVLTVDSLTPEAEGRGYPDGVDLSESPFFPPIGNQGQVGSCVSFSIAYYMRTFQEARENGWDLSSSTWSGLRQGRAGSGRERVFSPTFVFNQVNDGEDGGSTFDDNVRLVTLLGAATWQTCPLLTDPGDFSWPAEAAWREAPLYRGAIPPDGAHGADSYWFYVRDRGDIEVIKTLLANGIPVSLAVDANLYEAMDDQDVWTVDNYARPAINHANTIVGYVHD